jgi:hypothetical protein
MASGRHRTVTATVPPLIPGQRPAAPAELSGPQQAQWDSIVARLPAGWITDENAPLLKELCRHISFADDLAHDIEHQRASEKPNQRTLLALLRAHGHQTQRLASLATKLRLTQFSRYTRDAEGAAIGARNAGKHPWDDWGNGRH